MKVWAYTEFRKELGWRVAAIVVAPDRETAIATLNAEIRSNHGIPLTMTANKLEEVDTGTVAAIVLA